MKRAGFVIAILLAACGDDGSTNGMTPDANDEATGSGSGAVAAGIDPSPPDVALEWMVIGLSVIVVGGSVRSRRRAHAKTFEL